MQIITSMGQISELKDNLIIGNFGFVQSKIIFNGSGNVLIGANSENSAKITLKDTTIRFHNDNSVVFVNESVKNYSILIEIFNNSFCYIGANNYFDGTVNMQCSEQYNIFIGDDCLFSHGIRLWASDAHLIYDTESHKRINCAKSIFIGDHVWVGLDAKIWKGTHIGSGAILGASAFTTGKRIPSNTAWGGNPAKLIKHGVFFLGNNAQPFTNVEAAKWSDTRLQSIGI